MKETDGWTFRARFRRAAFGWRGSRLSIERLNEVLAEIRAAARHDPAHAAEGAVLLLEKLSPALCQVDSSSGALGNATYAAVEALVPVIASAPVTEVKRSKWLERLFEAVQEDDPPYIESLGDHCSWPGRLLEGGAFEIAFVQRTMQAPTKRLTASQMYPPPIGVGEREARGGGE